MMAQRNLSCAAVNGRLRFDPGSRGVHPIDPATIFCQPNGLESVRSKDG